MLFFTIVVESVNDKRDIYKNTRIKEIVKEIYCLIFTGFR